MRRLALRACERPCRSSRGRTSRGRNGRRPSVSIAVLGIVGVGDDVEEVGVAVALQKENASLEREIGHLKASGSLTNGAIINILRECGEEPGTPDQYIYIS
jgi:hypothetical protein